MTGHLYMQALRDAAHLSTNFNMVDVLDRARLYDVGLVEQMVEEEARRVHLMKMAGLYGSDPALTSVAQSIQNAIGQTTAADEARRALTVGLAGDLQLLGASRTIHDMFAELTRRTVAEPTLLAEAYGTAKLVHAMDLPASIVAFRTSVDSLTARMVLADAWRTTRDPISQQAFGHTASIADMLHESARVDRYVREAMAGFQAAEVPATLGLAQYRTLLDSAGLVLGRLPRLRLLTKAEKRRRLRARLEDNRESPPIRKAKSLVHQYERTLRDILDDEMAAEYGEDWAETRLETCGCRDLLGKWRARGGTVLDHADYKHYAEIMSHPQHFEAIFEVGFDCPVALRDLMLRAGKLRAASHHANPHFSTEDLRDLRAVWRMIETGLLALSPDHDVDFDRVHYDL